MNRAVPYFFFSYSQADTDPYLNRFFEDLLKRVAALDGLAISSTDSDKDEQLNQVGFRDRYGVKTGQDWRDKIGAAMQHSGVLVCVYSPNFFSRRQDKQFCGREFTAFLSRNPRIRYALGTGEPERRYQLQEARNILPIIWSSLRQLQNKDLPPYVVRLITWALDLARVRQNVSTRYLEVGVHRITVTGRGVYLDILNYFAERIIELAKDPLPPLPAVPDIETLHSAFWDDPEEGKIDRAVVANAVAEVMVAAATGGPTRMLVIEVRHAEDAPNWAPYVDEHSIPALFEEIANRKKLAMEWMTLDPSAPDFMARMLSALKSAAQNSIRPILVVDPRCLAHEAWREALFALLRHSYRAGFLVPADATDSNAIHLIEQYSALLQPTKEAPDWVVRISTGNITQFQTAVDSVADEILARIVNADRVRQSPPDNDGPTKLKRITNRPDTDRGM
jgi:hypothetical protein